MVLQTLKICQFILKIINLLYKQGFVVSQMRDTVVLKTSN